MAGAEASETWTAFPTRDGLRLVHGQREQVLPAGGPPAGDHGGAEGPALAIQLSPEEAACLVPPPAAVRAAGALAATHYGPAAQEKLDNEDFALAAQIAIENETWSLAVVADGVSTKTFWASRSSRLACLATLRAVRCWLLQEGGGPAGITDDALDALQRSLQETLLQVLQADQLALQRANHTPPGWAPDRYERWHHRDALWFNTTLLLAAVGPRGGVVLSCGDGAIVVERGGPDGRIGTRHVLLETDDDVRISTVVSLDPSRMQFVCARLRPQADGDTLRVVLATDGVDRGRVTLGLDPTTLYGSTSHAQIPTSPWETIRRVLDQADPAADNHSVAAAWATTAATASMDRPRAAPPPPPESAPAPVWRLHPPAEAPIPELTSGEIAVALVCSLSLPVLLLFVLA